MTPVVALKTVSKQFGQVTALDHVSLEIPPGTVCALLGANGAGKSTAIRVLLGLETPDTGVSEVLGMDSRKYALEIRRRVGYVAEKPALYEWMRVGEIGWFAAGFYPPGYAASYERYIDHFGLDTAQRISTLSKGQRAKVALALALAHQPELLILDEPTSGLDPLVRREFLESMVDVAAQGRTVLLCSHQVAEVERVADIVAILLNGRLACVERLDELKRDTREVAVTLADATSRPPTIPGDILARVQFGHEHIYMVRNLDEEQLAIECADHGPFDVRHPSLEDILLVMLREYRKPSSAVSQTSISASSERQPTDAPERYP
jgi:ABC-2 type transport system ATP-binding protein